MELTTSGEMSQHGIIRLNKKGKKMKDKLETIKTNLIMLLRRIEEAKCPEEVNYNLFWKLEEINERLGEIEMLIQELEEL